MPTSIPLSRAADERSEVTWALETGLRLLGASKNAAVPDFRWIHSLLSFCFFDDNYNSRFASVRGSFRKAVRVHFEVYLKGKNECRVAFNFQFRPRPV